MQARLGRGTWTLAADGDVHLGILRGDMNTGWNANVAILESARLPGIAACLNLGGWWTDGETSISVVDDQARVTWADGPDLVLDDAATARLQVFCALVSSGCTSTTSVLRTSTLLDNTRGRLRVRDLRAVGQPLAMAQPMAGRDGTVQMHVPTTAGPLSFGLPALQVLVAATEAERDGRALQVELPGLGTRPVVILASATESVDHAAEAQWLMPAFTRAAGRSRRDIA